MRSAIYRGTVMHARRRPVAHRFRYRIFTLLIDLDELPGLVRSLRWLSHNRFNVASVYDRDHGAARPGESLRAWAERTLCAAGLDPPGGRIELLCFPRLFGYVFNPLSVWFCRDPAGRLAAVIYEVHNTFGGRHAYALPVSSGGEGGAVAQHCGKEFYVSPFMPMDAQYSFRLKPPGDAFALVIREHGIEGEILRAAMSGRRRPLTGGELLKAVAAHPLMTLKVIAAIHWQALRLWRKGAPFHRNPAKRRPGEAAAP
ncbi:MAG: DUF1365 domain-containing protein [Rhodospirillaceae bacterium]|nr:DUF1365 domain-containing protein [Rhodospirillaceae bacterium]